MIALQEEHVRKEFEELHHDLDKWGNHVDEILTSFLKEQFKSFERVQFWPQHRVKGPDSYVQKALYRNKNFKNPIEEITDKVGTRVVLLNIDDVSRVSAFVQNNQDWEVVEKSRDIETEKKENPKVFDYKSDHFIIKPSENYDTATDRGLLTCEIQIRTLLQHAYAETSHDTMYKKGTKTEYEAQRAIASTMAFLEAADEKIKCIYDLTDKSVDYSLAAINLALAVYKTYNPTFDERCIDYQMARSLLSLLNDNEIKVFLENCERVATRRSEACSSAIEKPIVELFKQPALVISIYMLEIKQSTTVENWPFTLDALQALLKVMNISDDVILH